MLFMDSPILQKGQKDFLYSRHRSVCEDITDFLIEGLEVLTLKSALNLLLKASTESTNKIQQIKSKPSLGSGVPIFCIFLMLGLKQCCIQKTSPLGASEVSLKFVVVGKPKFSETLWSMAFPLACDLCCVCARGKPFKRISKVSSS